MAMRSTLTASIHSEVTVYIAIVSLHVVDLGLYLYIYFSLSDK